MVGYKVKGKKNAVDEELVGREEIGLRERGVSDHPELELRRGGKAAASSAAAGRREGLRLGIFGRNLHEGREMKKAERRGGRDEGSLIRLEW